MNNRKVRKIYGILLLIVAGVYSCMLFLLKSHFDMLHWINYGFTLASFVILYLHVAIMQDQYGRYSVFGVRISQIVFSLCSIEFVVFGVILMLFDGINWRIPLIFQILLIVIPIVLIGIVLMHKENVERNSNQVTEKRFLIYELEIKLRSVLDSVPQEYLKEYNRMIDNIKYSDPMSSNSLTEIESEISDAVDVLVRSISSLSPDELRNSIDSINKKVRERKERCVVYKNHEEIHA